MRSLKLFLLMSILLAGLLPGCRKTDDPMSPDSGTEFQFLPVDDVLPMTTADHLDFQARTRPEAPLAVTWLQAGEPCATGPRFRFLPEAPGLVELKALAEYAGDREEHRWIIEVLADLGGSVTFLPPTSFLTMMQGDSQTFRVLGSTAAEPALTWTLGSEVVGTDSLFLYLGDTVGVDTLAVRVQAQEQEITHRWTVSVASVLASLQYSPVLPEVTLIETQEQDFQVFGSLDHVELIWTLNDTVAGTGPLFHYQGEDPTTDALELTATAFGTTVTRQWNIQVYPLSSFPPHEVPNIVVGHGFQVGHVEVFWGGSSPGFLPVATYHIYVSYTGPPGPGDDEDAILLGSVSHQPDVPAYQAAFGPDQGILTDIDAWFAVRAADTLGQLSDWGNGLFFHIQPTWFANGRVLDDQGNGLAGQLIHSLEPELSVVTDGDGSFSLGPLAATAEVILQMEGGPNHYPYQPAAVDESEGQGMEVVLLSRYGSDPLCTEFEGEFLNYFMHMTKTSLTTPLRPDHRLYSWDQYPLLVHVPDFTSEEGLDFRQETLWCLDLWNQQLGEAIFVPTADPDAAQLVFIFSADYPHANGRTSLLLPTGASYTLGDVAPEKMGVMLNIGLPTVQRIRETALHELGHTLGLYRHAFCNEPGYLMYITASGVLDNGPENAIHPDELRAVQVIRDLPQGYDMGGFLLEQDLR